MKRTVMEFENIEEILTDLEYYSRFIVYEDSIGKSTEKVQKRIRKLRKNFKARKFSKVFTEEFIEEEGLEDE